MFVKVNTCLIKNYFLLARKENTPSKYIYIIKSDKKL